MYPDEAMPYIASGRLDKQLFNVTQLVAQDYDDAHTGAVPLIITRSDGVSAHKSGASDDGLPSAAALPGAKTTLGLPSVRGAAVEAQRSKAAAFWSALTGPSGQDPSRSTARTGPSSDNDVAAPSFTAGVDKVWLDGKAEAALADTTAQIGAPQAWGREARVPGYGSRCWTPERTPPTRTSPSASWRPAVSSPARTSLTGTAMERTPRPPSPEPALPPTARNGV